MYNSKASWWTRVLCYTLSPASPATLLGRPTNALEMVSSDRNRYVGDWDQDNHGWDFTFWWRKTGNKEEEGKGEEEEGEKEERKRDILVGGLVSGRSEIGLTFFCLWRKLWEDHTYFIRAQKASIKFVNKFLLKFILSNIICQKPPLRKWKGK